MKKIQALVVVCLATAAMLACDGNPVSDAREEVDRLYVNPQFITLTVNAEKKITGYPVNRYGEATFDRITVAACDEKVAVREDSTRLPVEPPTRVIARGAAVGSSCVTFRSGSLVDTVQVVVN